MLSLSLYLSAVPPIISVTPLPLYDPVFGDPTSIVCGSNNTVVGEWVWYHNGVRLADASTDTLTIGSAHTTMNDGLYQCFAYNEAGNNSSTARVAVVSKWLFVQGLLLYIIHDSYCTLCVYYAYVCMYPVSITLTLILYVYTASLQSVNILALVCTYTYKVYSHTTVHNLGPW